VHGKNQAAVAHLTVGMRVLPQIIIRAADARPVEIQDLLVADTRFKLFVFTGRPEGSQLELIRSSADALEKALGKVFPNGVREKATDIVSICIGDVMEMEYTVLPPILRSHWTKYVLCTLSTLVPIGSLVFVRVYVDDLDVTKTMGGKAYHTYGIAEEGAIVVVRPDGYVATVLPLSSAKEVAGYFSGFTAST
jgi:phenol 2-monooxygenase